MPNDQALEQQIQRLENKNARLLVEIHNLKEANNEVAKTIVAYRSECAILEKALEEEKALTSKLYQIVEAQTPDAPPPPPTPPALK